MFVLTGVVDDESVRTNEMRVTISVYILQQHLPSSRRDILVVDEE